MNRRQTLAPLSPSQLNAKGGASAAPGRCTKDGGAQPGKGGMPRKSIAPGLLAERAAAAGMGPDRRASFVKATGPKQDQRPLTNKDFQGSCIKRIITYLTANSFSCAISPKTLASPTGKDFAAIVTFLFQQVDPAFRIQGKVEDEVPAFFKRLNYPFQISKSALFAVGTPHSWPAVLAALNWLVELLEYADKANSSKGSGIENKVEDFLKYLAEGYTAFLSGDDERCQRLDDQFVAKFAEEEAELGTRCENLRKTSEQLRAELAQFRALRDPVELAHDQRKEQLMDNEKFEQLVTQDQGLKQSSLRKLTEKKADVQAKQDQIAAVIGEVEQLRQRVKGQTINKADLNRMIMERSKQTEVLAGEQARCEEMERRNNELDVQIIKLLTGMESLAERYNQLAMRLKLIPATSKRAGGTNFELRLNRTAISQAEFSNLDLKGVVKPTLERLCEAYRTRANDLAQDLISLRETCTARAEGCLEKQDENSLIQGEIAKVEAQLQAAKDAQDEKCKRLVAQAENIKAQVDGFYNAATNRTEHMEEQLSRAQIMHEQAKRDATIAKLEADLKQAIKMLIAHKEFVSQTVAQTVAGVRQVKEEVAALHHQKLRLLRV
ncbi:hypothetical protein PLESTM_000508700 [Pleodorina starrii]|nr:hypothetical protein PLESTM_000508700 [Pleodorina starrii]